MRGLDGLDEISTEGPTTVWDATGPRVTVTSFSPETFGVPRSPLSALRGGDAERNAELAREVLNGAAGPIRDVVVANSAAAWAAWAAVVDPARSLAERIDEGLQKVTDALDSGAAADLLVRWAALTQSMDA